MPHRETAQNRKIFENKEPSLTGIATQPGKLLHLESSVGWRVRRGECVGAKKPGRGGDEQRMGKKFRFGIARPNNRDPLCEHSDSHPSQKRARDGPPALGFAYVTLAAVRTWCPAEHESRGQSLRQCQSRIFHENTETRTSAWQPLARSGRTARRPNRVSGNHLQPRAAAFGAGLPDPAAFELQLAALPQTAPLHRGVGRGS